MTHSTKRGILSSEIVARYPVSLTAADLLACSAIEESQPEPIDFTPVPRLRKRRGGWSEETQRAFIACLQRTGSVATSARAVGMTPSTAYRLLDVEGAESFAIAWDKAFEEGLARLRQDSLDRALNGALVPVYRKGRLVRVEHRRSDRMAIALLGGRNQSIDWYRQGALRRHVYKQERKVFDEEQAERKRREEEAECTAAQELQRMIDKAAVMRGPRIRRL